MADNIVRQNSDIPWADFRDIEYGGGTLEVLRVDGNTFVAVPSMVRRELLSSSQTAARDLNRIMGEGFQSSIQKVRTTRNPKAINAIALKEFRKVIRALDKKGVPAASALLDALLDVALETVTDAAFGLDTREVRELGSPVTSVQGGKATRGL